MAAEEGRNIDEVASEKILKDGYVDDGLSGSNSEEEICRLRGDQLSNEGGGYEYTGTIAHQIRPRIFKKYKYKTTKIG